LLYARVNLNDKNSKKNALAKIDKFIGKGGWDDVIVK
jgi:hypothetical protein